MKTTESQQRIDKLKEDKAHYKGLWKQGCIIIDALSEQLEKLEQWKKESMETTLPLIEFMQKREDVKIGNSCHAKAIEFIQERDELIIKNKELEEKLLKALQKNKLTT